MQDKLDRLHFMDSMRAILMILGVVLHSAQVFNPRQSWVLYSSHNDQLFNYLVNIISTFRMPAFFIVSGYFCFVTLNKYKVRKFLTLRLKRIIVPFIFTALTLNSLQALLLDWSGWHQFEFFEYILKGEYVSHLWFLTNLVVYFIVASVLAAFFVPVIKPIGKVAEKCINVLPMTVVVFVMPLFSIMILGLNKIGFPLYSNFLDVFNTYSILKYAPFFIFGVLMGTNRSFLQRISTTNPVLCLIVVMLSVFLVGHIENTDNWFTKVTVAYLELLSTWFAVLICFFIFYRYLNKQSKTMLYLSDASYSVYLFHHVTVIAVGVLLITLDFPAILGAFTLMFVVTATTLFIHSHIILKNKILLFMFNGK